MMKRLTAFVAPCALIVILTASVLSAQDKDVAGTWSLSVEGMTMTMVLAQNGKTITGTLDSPHGFIKVKGEFADGKITFTGALEDGPHPLEVSAKGTLRSDGSLAGDLTSSVGDMAWTAVREARH